MSSTTVTADDVARPGSRHAVVAPDAATLHGRMGAAMMVAMLDGGATRNHLVVADSADALRPMRRKLRKFIEEAGVRYNLAQTADSIHMFIVDHGDDKPSFWAFLEPHQVRDPDKDTSGATYWWLGTDRRHSKLRMVSERTHCCVVVGSVLDPGPGAK